MIITHVSVDGFRNLSGVSVEPSAGFNVISGKNAQGKTNFLEAMWILSGCRSFRGSKERDYLKIGGESMRSEMVIKDSRREQTISYSMSRNSPDVRSIEINGVGYRGTRPLFGVFRCVSFTPEDKEIVRGSPEKRRAFMDMGASQLDPAMVPLINRFNAVMSQRNALLKKIMRGQANSSQLDVWDRQTAQLGAKLSFMRHAYICATGNICSQLYGAISGGSEELELTYRSNVFSEGDLENTFSPQACELYYKKLTDSRERDLISGTTSAGAGRDEMTVKIDGMSAREYGSQGQIKSTALVMKLAQAQVFMRKCSEPPVIFLDDVMGELDGDRQRSVFEIIRDMQVFVTVPNADAVIPEMKGRLFTAEGGEIYEQDPVSPHRE